MRPPRRALAIVLLTTACAPKPDPVIDMPELRLPDTPGERALPSDFIGIVLTPDWFGCMTVSGEPDRCFSPPDPADAGGPEVLDYLLEAHEHREDADVVWFIDQRVPTQAAATLLLVAARLHLDPVWHATGSLQAPRIHAIPAPAWTGPEAQCSVPWCDPP